MNTDKNYNPAEDDNQGVAQLLAQGKESSPGVSQFEYLSPVTNQGPEPEKAEVNDSDGDANGINDDLLEEEAVEDHDVDEEE